MVKDCIKTSETNTTSSSGKVLGWFSNSRIISPTVGLYYKMKISGGKQWVTIYMEPKCSNRSLTRETKEY